MRRTVKFAQNVLWGKEARLSRCKRRSSRCELVLLRGFASGILAATCLPAGRDDEAVNNMKFTLKHNK